MAEAKQKAAPQPHASHVTTTLFSETFIDYYFHASLNFDISRIPFSIYNAAHQVIYFDSLPHFFIYQYFHASPLLRKKLLSRHASRSFHSNTMY